MKRLFLSAVASATLALAACTPVYAGQLVAPNDMGGAIVLTDSPCVYEGVLVPGFSAAFAFGVDDNAVPGCWQPIDETSYGVVWFAPQGRIARIYPAAGFQSVSNGSPPAGDGWKDRS